MLKHFILPLLCSVLALACQGGDDIQARAAELEASPGLRVRITAAGELPQTTVHAIARHIEGQAENSGAAMVRVKKEDGSAPILEIELWGGTLPAAGNLADALKAAFPALASADITIAQVAPGQAPPLPIIAVEEDLSPAEAEQQIREQLAADGLDGEVDVKVADGPEGRRVEVAVKKTEVH